MRNHEVTQRQSLLKKFSRLRRRNGEDKMIFKSYERIVFAGDSVTDVGSANPVGDGFSETLGNGYVRIIDNLLSAVYPDVFVRVTIGIGDFIHISNADALFVC